MANREADLINALASGHATADEEKMLDSELTSLRTARRRAIAGDRGLELGDAVVQERLAPVAAFERTSSKTDWVLDLPEHDAAHVAREVTAEATLWYNRLHQAVREDAEEFGEQARGYGQRFASQYDEAAPVAYEAFIAHVSHLNKGAAWDDGQSGESDNNGGTVVPGPQYYDGVAPVTEEVLDNLVEPTAPNEAAESSNRAPNVTSRRVRADKPFPGAAEPFDKSDGGDTDEKDEKDDKDKDSDKPFPGAAEPFDKEDGEKSKKSARRTAIGHSPKPGEWSLFDESEGYATGVDKPSGSDEDAVREILNTNRLFAASTGWVKNPSGKTWIYTRTDTTRGGWDWGHPDEVAATISLVPSTAKSRTAADWTNSSEEEVDDHWAEMRRKRLERSAPKSAARKINGDDLDAIRSAVAPLDTTERRAKYLAGDFPRSDAVKDLDKRYRWDLIWAASDAAGPDGLYHLFPENTNDAHFDTALRSIVPTLASKTAADEDIEQDGHADSSLTPIEPANADNSTMFPVILDAGSPSYVGDAEKLAAFRARVSKN